MIRICKTLGKMLSLDKKRKELIQSGEGNEQMQIGFWKKSEKGESMLVIELLFVQHGRRPHTHIQYFLYLAPRWLVKFQAFLAGGLLEEGR